ncbi:MAG: hypothetical protein RUDDFDWM_000701 [Candidatus Fervidibacterota bacterium]
MVTELFLRSDGNSHVAEGTVNKMSIKTNKALHFPKTALPLLAVLLVMLTHQRAVLAERKYGEQAFEEVQANATLQAEQDAEQEDVIQHEAVGTPKTPEVSEGKAIEVLSQSAKLIMQRHGDEWLMRASGGNVEIKTRDLIAYASNLQYNPKEGVVRFLPPVEGRATNLSFRVGSLSYYIKEGRWELKDGRMKVEPSFFAQGVVEPLYLRATNAEGSQNKAYLKASLFTSCDKELPHWSLRAETMDIIANDKVIARDVGIYLGSRKLFTLPTLVISIKPRRRRTTFMPDVGRNEIEGWFIKYAHTYMADERSTGIARFDWAEKRGLGLGIEQDYTLKAMTGAVALYWLRDRNKGTELNWSIRHSHRFSKSLLMNLQSEVRSNSAYFIRRARSSSLSASLQWNRTNMQTTLDLRRLSYSGYGETNDTSILLRSSLRRDKWDVRLQSTYRRFESSYFGIGAIKAPDEELQHRFEVRRDGTLTTWSLIYEQRIDLDKARNTADTYFGLERLPEITFNLRLHRSQKKLLPLTFSTSIGKFAEYPARVRRARLAFSSDIGQTQIRLSHRANIMLTGRFEQCFYDDATAQYTYGMLTQVDWNIGKRSRLLIGYQLQKQHGWTPFRFDIRPPYESADLQLYLEPSERFQASLTTGLDIQNNIFRDITANMQWHMLSGLWLAVSSGYDIERGRMRDVISWVAIGLPGKVLSKSTQRGYPASALPYYGYGSFYIPSYMAYSQSQLKEELDLPPWGIMLNLSSRYSTVEKKLALIRSFVDWRIGKAWRLQLLASYNGMMRRMDYVQTRLTRDLHCYEVSLTYNSLTREWRVEFNLKAFPTFRQFFGTSDRSQLLDTSVGQLF